MTSRVSGRKFLPPEDEDDEDNEGEGEGEGEEEEEEMEACTLAQTNREER